MADYWKSQPKKFCTYCKCWIADNKPSIDFHERGKNHKENVVRRISEIKKKSMDKAKEEEKSSKDFAAMEEAALKAYQEDLKRLGIAPAAEDTTSSVTSSSAQTKQQKRKEKKKKVVSVMSSAIKSEWTKGVSPEGYTYYYNHQTRESQWEEPEGFQESTQKSEKTGATSAWVEGVTEEGHIYYYNTETRESRWEKPEDSIPCNDDAISESSEDDVVPGESTIEAAEKESKSTSGESTEQEEGKAEETSETQKPKITFRNNSAAELTGVGEESQSEARKDDTDAPVDEEQSRAVPETEAKAKQPRESKRITPYGNWEEIRKEEDPYENVDLQLPNVEDEFLPGPALEIPREPKVKFREKTITSLGDDTIGEPVFRKRKIENGKSRNLRQRVSDQ